MLSREHKKLQRAHNSQKIRPTCLSSWVLRTVPLLTLWVTLGNWGRWREGSNSNGTAATSEIEEASHRETEVSETRGQGRNWRDMLASYRQRVGREKNTALDEVKWEAYPWKSAHKVWGTVSSLSPAASPRSHSSNFTMKILFLLLFHHENHSHRHITKSTCRKRNDSNVQFSRTHIKKKKLNHV